MIAVALSASEAEKILAENYISPDDAVIACVNSPESVTLSGKSEPMDVIHGILKQRSILCKRLPTGGKAYHSPIMKEVGSGYSEAILEATARSSNSALALGNGLWSSFSQVTLTEATGRRIWRVLFFLIPL
jgi:acyl transferase domain-containing protein